MTAERSASPPTRLTNLPLPLTSFIGRRREVVEVQRLLKTTRLLTLIGAGGVGKTRLALQVASTFISPYRDGIWLVPLEGLAEPALVPRQLASVLGVGEEPGYPLAETLAGTLRPRVALIVLDNCEHLLAACGALAETLLQACPDVHILATSRQPLGIAGETTWRVPSLALPNPRRRPPVERLREVEAVQLFAARAAAALPGFAVTEQNAAAVAEVCRRLDGMPLALELAAARARVLSVEQIASRLDDRFRLLTGGSPTALPRQQTLLGTLEWSHESLDDQERRLLRRLSVFAGGWTLEAAEAVCAGDGIAPGDVLILLGQLVDKSLAIADEHDSGAARYRLLETIRQYGAEKLHAAGEERALRGRHATWFLSLAEAAGRGLHGPAQAAWLARLLTELDNLRAALEWATHDTATAEAGLRACGAAYRLWMVHGYLGEGRRWVAQLLAAVALGLSWWRAQALFAAAGFALFQGEYEAARALVEESLTMARAMGDAFQVAESQGMLALLVANQGHYAEAWALIQDVVTVCRSRMEPPRGDAGSGGASFGEALYGDTASRRVALGHALMLAGVVARLQGEYPSALGCLEESLELLRRQGDVWFVAQALSNLGLVAHEQGAAARARNLFEEALALRRGIGDRSGIAWSLNDLGQVALAQGDLNAARASYSEGLAIVRELGDRSGIADALVSLGQVARARDDLHMARSLYAESLTIRREIGHRLGLPAALEAVADLAAAEGQALRAIRLAGAAAALRESIGSSAPPTGPRLPAPPRALLGEAASAAAWHEGRAMSEEQALDYAVAAPSGEAARPKTPLRATRRSGSPLSDRETEIAVLIALGRTNRQIAQELVIAEGTADRHVSNILSKLGLDARAQVGVWAAERGLIPSAPSEPG